MATITQTPVVPVSRKLGTLEKFFSLVDRHRPVHFAVAAHILGRTTISACRTALDALQERHPLFSVGIEQPIGGLPRFRSTTVPIAIRIVDPRLSTWQAEMARELANPFRTRQAPLMRAVLLHRTNESTLILTAHHSIANGLSLSYAMRDVLQALRGETLQPLPSLPAQEPLMYMLQEESAGDGDSAQSEPIQESQPVAFRPLNGSLPSIEALSLLTDSSKSRDGKGQLCMERFAPHLCWRVKRFPALGIASRSASYRRSVLESSLVSEKIAVSLFGLESFQWTRPPQQISGT